MRHGWLPRILSIVLVFPMVLSAVADEPAGEDGLASGDRDVARLEALLEAQQQRIDALSEQVAAARQQDADAQRVEVMRQQIREVLSEREFRETLMPSVLQAGYDDGFFIRSSDNNFEMKINGLLQFRWQHYATRATNRYLNPGLQRDDRTGFDMQRIRLDISGHAYSPDLTYFVELQADSADGYDFVIGGATVNYRFSDELQFQAGMFKLASTRANGIGNDKMQFIDRPVVDAVFGFGFGVGTRFWGQLFEKRLDWYLDIVNSVAEGESFGGGRTITTDPAELDSSPAVLLRAVWHALSDDPATDFVDEADLRGDKGPALDLGFHYAFNDDQADARTTRIPFPLPRRFAAGGFGLTNTNGTQINQFGFDAAFKCQGFSATGEYVLRIVDPRRAGRRPFSNWWLASGQDDTTVQHGAYVQAGYFLPIPGLEDKLEVVARVGGISALADHQEGTWEYAAGLNYYIDGNNIKLQTDMLKVSEAPISNPYSGLANVNDDVLLFRVQLQVAF